MNSPQMRLLISFSSCFLTSLLAQTQMWFPFNSSLVLCTVYFRMFIHSNKIISHLRLVFSKAIFLVLSKTLLSAVSSDSICGLSWLSRYNLFHNPQTVQADGGVGLIAVPLSASNHFILASFISTFKYFGVSP